MSAPLQVPIENWIYGHRPGSIRLCYGTDAEACIHGVPIRVFDCPLCWPRERPEVRARRFGWRPWFRLLGRWRSPW